MRTSRFKVCWHQKVCWCSPSVNYLFSLVLNENVICFLYPLSPRKTTYKKTDTDKHTSKQPTKQTKNKHTNRQTSKQKYKQANKNTDKQTKYKRTKNNGLLFSSTYPSLADIAKWQTSLFFLRRTSFSFVGPKVLNYSSIIFLWERERERENNQSVNDTQKKKTAFQLIGIS